MNLIIKILIVLFSIGIAMMLLFVGFVSSGRLGLFGVPNASSERLLGIFSLAIGFFIFLCPLLFFKRRIHQITLPLIIISIIYYIVFTIIEGNGEAQIFFEWYVFALIILSLLNRYWKPKIPAGI